MMTLKEAIKKHLEEVAKKDKQFAKSLKKENKSYDECEKYIIQEVKKQAKGKNEVGIPDEEIYNLAIHYFDEDDIKVGGATPSAKVVHSDAKNTKAAKKTSTKKKAEVVEDDEDGYEPISLEIPLF